MSVYMHAHSVFFQGLHFGSLCKLSLQHVTSPAKQLMKSLGVSKEGKKREKQRIYISAHVRGCASVPLSFLSWVRLYEVNQQ